MSNSNNPFLPYLTEENDNKQNNNNDISKILEEGSASTVPPPAYDEIVKPQPTQPSSEYPAYPPPPFSPPEVPIRENYNQSNQSNQSPNAYMNSNEKRGRSACCCFGSSQRNKSCCCCWMVILIIFIIMGIVSLTNNRVCNNLALGGTPETFSFDLNVNPTFQIDTYDARIRYGEVRISQSSGNSNQTVNIQVFTGSSGITPKFGTSSQNGIFELKISQIGSSIFNIPPRCMISQINVNLPQQSSSPNTIQVNDLDLTMGSNVSPYQQNITLSTNSGNVNLTNITAKTININTIDGDIVGSITSISDELSISTNGGDMKLYLGNAQTPFDPKIDVTSSDGDVELIFDGSSFSGNYTIRTYDGGIRIDDTNLFGNQASGTINNGTGYLTVETEDGDIFVSFQGN